MMRGWQCESTDGPKRGWSCAFWNDCSDHLTNNGDCSVALHGVVRSFSCSCSVVVVVVVVVVAVVVAVVLFRVVVVALALALVVAAVVVVSSSVV